MKRLFRGCILLAAIAANASIASADLIHPYSAFTLRADSEESSPYLFDAAFNGQPFSGYVTHVSNQIDRTYLEFKMSSIRQPVKSASLLFSMSSPYDTTINVGTFRGAGNPNPAVWWAPLRPLSSFHVIDPPSPPEPGGEALSPDGPAPPGYLPNLTKPNSLDVTDALKSFANDRSAYIVFAFSIPNDSIGKQASIQPDFTPAISIETDPNPTPEPASTFLAISGATGVIGFCLRCRKRM
jgi:hypothetical protein